MPILIPTFFLISLVYSMVGLGGGSAYITAMVLAGVPKETFPSIALLCNLLVASQGFVRFKKAGHFRWKLFWPFAVTSIPCAYIGGRMNVPDKAFIVIMAAALTLAAVRLIFWRGSGESREKNLPNRVERRISFGPLAIRMTCGCILGLLAGITGIGGGIYLIPTLILLGWATAKETSAVASLFIVVNSASGLAGQLSKGFIDLKLFLPLAAVVIIGGFIGSKTGATKLKGETLQKIVGIIMLVAVVKLIGKLL